jgi:predicted dinucleotide-binding enzyme/DMSO/TMAO reductase YedYZ heme-binding membrane subunit
MHSNRCIGIVGCGDMGYAIAYRLYLCGFTIVMGSRTPDKRTGSQFEIVSIVECIRRSPIIFIAIHLENYIDSLVSHLQIDPLLFNGKILIDLSNQPGKKSHLKESSNAEQLQTAIPNAFVVKAFNNISSFLMQSTTTSESRSVFVASDYPAPKEKVIMLAREMNFNSFDVGSLRAARHLENDARSLFPAWRIPIIVTLVVVFIWLIYTLCMEYVSTNTTSWNQLFLNIPNKVFCVSAITLLAIVYMPSNLACIFQLAYGTREQRFPNWLDRWLLSRKQLGLLAFLIALTHSLMTLILMGPAYYSTWFYPVEIVIPANYNQTPLLIESGLMTTKGEIASTLGILTQLCMSILAVTSIPAVGNLLNWREWRFVQSKLGIVTLLLAVGHVVAMALPRWIAVGVDKAFYNLGLLCLYFPLLTLFLKFLFWLPCFSRPLYRIRRGQPTKKTSQP